MADLISSLPEALICHILSFLSTKEAVATSVLSKRWMPLWRSVPTLDFDDFDYYLRSNKTYYRFVQSISAVILARDFNQPIQRFSFRYSCSHFYELPVITAVNIWVNAAVQLKVQHIHLSFNLPSLVPLKPPANLSSFFSCKTLMVLKLQGIQFTNPFSSVHLPVLKVLHLQDLSFPGRASFAELLSGCPVLEDFKTNRLYFHEGSIDTEFKILPKLLRAHIAAESDFFLLGVVNNVEFLQIDDIHCSLGDGTSSYVFPMFHNLTHIKLVYSNYNNNWAEVVELLKYCPKLQVLVIDQPDVHFCGIDEFKEEVGVWQYPPCVPECILLHLKRCCLNGYIGTKGELEFARYIMRKARFLQRMTISSGMYKNQWGKLALLKKLYSCTRCSATCKFSFS